MGRRRVGEGTPDPLEESKWWPDETQHSVAAGGLTWRDLEVVAVVVVAILVVVVVVVVMEEEW